MKLRIRGFTLIELMIVIAIIAIIAAIAIPNLIEARKNGNETAAIGALKTIGTAQSLFREADKEADGNLDYGSLAELSTAGTTGRSTRSCSSYSDPIVRAYWSFTAVEPWFLVEEAEVRG